MSIAGIGSGGVTATDGWSHCGLPGTVVESGYSLTALDGDIRGRGSCGRVECHMLGSVSEWPVKLVAC